MKKRSRFQNGKLNYSHLEPRNLLAGDVVCGDSGNNLIIARVDAADSSLIQIEVDGVVVHQSSISSSELITVDGLGGDDTFLLDYSNGEPVTAGGFSFDGGSGIDAVEINSTEGLHFIYETTTNSIGSLEDFLVFESVEVLVGGLGDDLFDLKSINEDVRVVGGAGNDVFRLNSEGGEFSYGQVQDLDGDISIEGGTGQNRIFLSDHGGSGLDISVTESTIIGHNEQFEIEFTSTGGSFARTDGEIGGITVFGARNHGDSVEIDSLLGTDSIRVRTDAQRDTIRVSEFVLGDVHLDAGSGLDNIFVHFAETGDRIIETTGALSQDDNDDDIAIFLTPADDNVTVMQDGVFLGDQSVVNVASTSRYRVFGRDGNDHFLLQDYAVHWAFGEAGNDTFEFRGTFDDIFVKGGDGDDLFDTSNAVRFLSGSSLGGDSGDDNFFGKLVGQQIYGSEGSDTYDLEIIPGASGSFLNESGAGFDTAIITVLQASDMGFYQTAFSSKLELDFEPGFETVFVDIHEFESFTLLTGNGDERITTDLSGVDITINTGAGNDVIQIGDSSDPNFGTVTDSNFVIEAGAGFNQLIIDQVASDSKSVFVSVDDSTAEPTTVLKGSIPEDSWSIRATSTGGVFNSQDGRFSGISAGSGMSGYTFYIAALLGDYSFEMNGSENKFNISRRAQGDIFTGVLFDSIVTVHRSFGDRVVDLRSLGPSNSNNVVHIVGSSGSDRFELHNDEFHWGTDERVLFDSKWGTVNVLGYSGDDHFQIDATIEQVVFRLFGHGGDDTFVTSSNLNALDGRVAIFAGSGTDSLRVDDSGANFGYNYHVDRNFIGAIAGPNNAVRDFAGIAFGSSQLEDMTLVASQGNNLVRARANISTRVLIEGGSGVDTINLIPDPYDGHQLELDDNESGKWVFNFAYLDLLFDDFENQREDDF